MFAHTMRIFHRTKSTARRRCITKYWNMLSLSRIDIGFIQFQQLVWVALSFRVSHINHIHEIKVGLHMFAVLCIDSLFRCLRHVISRFYLDMFELHHRRAIHSSIRF